MVRMCMCKNTAGLKRMESESEYFTLVQRSTGNSHKHKESQRQAKGGVYINWIKKEVEIQDFGDEES